MYKYRILKMDEYETVILVKQKVFVYKLPPRTNNRGCRAFDWKLDKPDWIGRLRVVTREKDCYIKLEDKNSGELFSTSPIDNYPGLAIESVLDSSRYFVLRIQDDKGHVTFIGIGFAERSDSFDLKVALQDHFKWLQNIEQIEENSQLHEDSKPNLDLSFKDGQTVRININIGKKSGTSKPRPKSSSFPGAVPDLLPPPPPGGVKTSLLSESSSTVCPVGFQSTEKTCGNSSTATDLLLDPGSPRDANTTPAVSSTCQTVTELWDDFTTAIEPAAVLKNPESMASTSWPDF